MFKVFKNRHHSKNKQLYFDNASATPINNKVLLSMQEYFSNNFHNPGALYLAGVNTCNVIESSRVIVADILKAQSSEIYFVDGGTEANNIAIIGTLRIWQKNNPDRIPHIITTQIEHASIIETCNFLETEGVMVTYLPVDKFGLIDIKELKESLTENTIMVSVGYVNGEIGTIQDIRGIMKTIRHYRKHNDSVYPYMHTDAVQAVNYVDEIGAPQLGIDLMTINASKIYGPKKIAILFKKKNIDIEPIVFGGNQESGLRSGTENVPYIVGMARSLSLARKIQPVEKIRLQKLKDYFIAELKNNFKEIIINAEGGDAIPNIVNITFPDISHEEIVIRLDVCGIMCSVKSACKAGEDGDSHVIRAISDDTRPTGSIRFSMGRDTQQKDIDVVVNELREIVKGMNDTYQKYYKA